MEISFLKLFLSNSECVGVFFCLPMEYCTRMKNIRRLVSITITKKANEIFFLIQKNEVKIDKLQNLKYLIFHSKYFFEFIKLFKFKYLE